MADVNSMWAFYGIRPGPELLPKARAAAQRALAIDDSFAEAHTALAVISLLDWDFGTSEREFLRAIELDPRYALARYWYGFHYLQLLNGRDEEGIEQCRLALEADPLATFPQVMMGLALTMGRRFDEAVPHLERAVSRDPSNFFTHRTAGLHAMLQGRYDEALRSYGRSVKLSGHPWPEAELGMTLVKAGRADEARAVQAGMQRRAETAYVSPLVLSWIPAVLGETDRAIAFLEQALEVRDPTLYVVGHWPPLEPMRGEARFDAIRRRVGLPGV